MANPVSISKTLATADADGICVSQTPLAGGNLTINGALATGGVATLDTGRRVLLTFASDETGRVFTLYGTNQNGSGISETVAGAAATAVGLLDYKTVTRVTVDAATAGALTVGTNGVGATPPQSVSYFQGNVILGFGVDVVGSANFTVQIAYEDDPCGISTNGVQPAINWFDVTALAAKAVDTSAVYSGPVTCWRTVINSGAGTVVTRMVQSGISDNL